MTSIKTLLCTAGAAAALSLGVVGLSAGSASAYVVCNAVGDCWHTDHRYHYGPDVRPEYHPDDWYFHRDWAHDNGHHWRDYHNGRGVYRNGVWVTF